MHVFSFKIKFVRAAEMLIFGSLTEAWFSRYKCSNAWRQAKRKRKWVVLLPVLSLSLWPNVKPSLNPSKRSLRYVGYHNCKQDWLSAPVSIIGSPPKSSPAGGILPGEIRPRGGFLHANVSPGDFLHEKSPPRRMYNTPPLWEIRPRHYDFAPSHEEVSPCIWPVKTWKLFITGVTFLTMKCHEKVSLSRWPEN